VSNILPRIIIIIAVFFSGFSQSYSAGQAVEILQGKIKTILEKKSISVFLLDVDGSILDIASPDGQGNFQIDPTVLDEPTYKNLVKLSLHIKNKKGTSKKYRISNNIAEFIDNKMKLSPLIFP